MGSIAEKMGVGSAVENNASQGTSDHVFKDLYSDDLNRFFFSIFSPLYVSHLDLYFLKIPQ